MFSLDGENEQLRWHVEKLAIVLSNTLAESACFPQVSATCPNVPRLLLQDLGNFSKMNWSSTPNKKVCDLLLQYRLELWIAEFQISVFAHDSAADDSIAPYDEMTPAS